MRACPNCGSTRFRVKYVEPPFRVVLCRACRLLYLGNPPDESQLYEAYYEPAPPEADAYRPASPVAELAGLYAINEQRIACLQRMKPEGRLLDVGCGRGYFLETARRHGFTPSGIDVSERAVSYARSAFGLEATVRSLEALRVAGQRFDVITLWHVLEHFPDPFAALEHVRALLNPTGLCVLEVPNRYSLKFLLSRQKWEGGNHPRYHRTFFSTATLGRALREQGFSRVQRIRLSYRLPDRPPGYAALKTLLNQAGLDAFLAFAAWQ